MIELRESGTTLIDLLGEMRVGDLWADRQYRVTIKEWRDGRSTGKDSQNNHIHGHVRDIVRGGFGDGTVSGTKRALAAIAADHGEYPTHIVLGKRLPVDDADLDSHDAYEFIEFLHRFAGEWGITLTEKEWA